VSIGNDALQALLLDRGAVMIKRGDASIPAHFGSAARELSACVHGVGIANRSDLGKLAITGTRESVQALARRHAGVELARGGIAETPEEWWCADAVDRLLVIVSPERRAQLHDALDQLPQAHAREDLTVCDTSATLGSVAVVGRRLYRFLAALGLASPNADPRPAAPSVRSPCSPDR
jgi:glycine cleavage system aminomethyltransferase T